MTEPLHILRRFVDYPRDVLVVMDYIQVEKDNCDVYIYNAAV